MPEPSGPPWERFAALGDPARMRARIVELAGGRFGEVVGDAATFDVLEVRLTAGLKPSRHADATVGVSYRFRLPGAGEVVLHGLAGPTDRGDRSDAAVEVHEPASGWTLPLRRLPDDPELPGLDHLFDAGHRRAAVGLDTEVAVDRHAIGDHVTARLIDPTGRVIAFAKTYRPGRLDALLSRRATVLAHLGSAAGATAQPPRAVLGDTAVFDVVPGLVPTTEDLHRAKGAAGLTAAGRILARLHATPIGDLRVDDPGEREGEARKKAAKLVAAAAELSPALDRIVGVFQGLGAGPMVCLHGDVHPGQLLVDGPDVSVIDLDSLRLGEPEQDLAELYVQLCHLGVPVGRAAELAMATIGGYRAAGGMPIDRARLVRHVAIEWITRAYTPFRSLRPAWAPDVAAWLAGWDQARAGLDEVA